MKRFSISFLLVISSAPAFAADAGGDDHVETSAGPVITLTDALQRASENNPALVAERFEERAAEALIEQADVRPNPTLDVELENFLGTGMVQGVDRLETTVQANQTLERGGKREKRVALAGRGRDTAVREFAVHRINVLAATAVAFVGTLTAQQRLALAEEPLHLARATLTAANERVREGAASPAEPARARVAVAAAQAEAARAQAALLAARSALAATWGGSTADVGRLTGTVRMPETLPDETQFQAALSRHPRLELQKAIVAERLAALELAQSLAVEDITIGGGVRFLRESTDAAFVAGVSVPLPIRNKNQGNIRAARESLAGAEHATRAIESELRTRLTAVWQEMKAAYDTAQSLRRDALPATEEAYTIVRGAYDEGQLPLIDVLDAQRALIAIRREIFDAESSYAAALARVESHTASAYPLTSALFVSE